MNENIDRIAVLIPAFNAGNTLHALFERLSPYVLPGNVLVVSDGSTDGTPEIARELGARVVTLEENCGKGAALQKGFAILKDDPLIDDIITIDADLQHCPEDLVAFVQKKRETGADIVVGLRNRTGTKMPIHRRLSNTVTSFLVSVRTGTNIRDSQCGFRLISKNVLKKVAIHSTGFEAETEFLIKAVKQGFTVEFVPIATIYNGEQSHMKNWKTTVNFTKILFRD